MKKSNYLRIPKLTEQQVNDFWAKVDKNGPNGCWLWTAFKNKTGYGRKGLGDGPVFAAHRLSYFINFKADPGDFHVCHRCDNPSCVNPDHLFLGTQQDNIDDARDKNRIAVGSMYKRSKLNEAQVIQIRQMYATGKYSQLELATLFKVKSDATINHIIKRKNWKHI